MAKEIVPAFSTPMDDEVELLLAHQKCKENERFWHKQAEEIEERIKMLLGDSVEGTVNGREAVTYEYTDRMRTADFKKDDPELYEIYVEEHEVRSFNVEKFKLARPDLYRRYQSRTLLNKFSVM